MLKRAQDLPQALQALEPARGPQRSSRHGRGARAEELGADEAPRKKHEALRQRRIRTRDVAELAQIERELFKVEEQLVQEDCRAALLAAKSATLAALERLEKARKELDLL